MESKAREEEEREERWSERAGIALGITFCPL